MHIKQLTISNYKSFYQPMVFNFEPGFNVLLGANSSGKTSVLEALHLGKLENVPHRSILNVVDADSVQHDAPSTQISFSADIDEVCKAVLPIKNLYVSIEHLPHVNPEIILPVLNRRLQNESILFDFKYSPNGIKFAKLRFCNQEPAWRDLNNHSPFLSVQVETASGEALEAAYFSGNLADLDMVWQKISPKIYMFSSERSVQPTSSHHPNTDLLPNISNLAYCINHLQSSDKDLFEELNFLLHRVFPTIHWVGAPPNAYQQFELKVHTNPSALKRGDLAIPIHRVGTGVGNALAMLYVALTAQTQRFILLEEPNSFLHPRALRELLAILAEKGNKHQFFITTHSSDVLRTINASTVTLLEHDGQQTTIKQTTGSKLHELRAGLIDLGIRLTDLHGCDEVIWVEGETEEAIFPKLLRHYFPEKAQGIAVLPLHSTGDFESKKIKTKKVAEIYKRLSNSTFLAPPMVAITLDREARSDAEVQHIKEECGGIVHFLPKTMLEDYLLDADAIAAVLSRISNAEVSTAQVEEALVKTQNETSCRLEPMRPNAAALHGAKVLNSVFQAFATSEYQKTKHGPELVQWLLEKKPGHFDELRDWFKEFLL
jgi:hypothetical protein